MTTALADVVIAGCRPSGLLAAEACARRGLDVQLIGPSPRAGWGRELHAWVDEVAAAGLEGALSHRWEAPRVRLDEEREHRLERAYGRFDAAALQALLLERIEAGGGEVRDAVVAQVDHAADHSRVVLEDGSAVRTRVFVDTTGAEPSYTRRRGPGATAFHTSYQMTAEVAGAERVSDGLLLMDLSEPGPAAVVAPGGVPTHLRAMRLGGDRVVFAESVLVGRPPVPTALLGRRLRQRLAHRGVEIRAVLATEERRVPMDAALPVLDQRTVGFGGAATLMHPTTGDHLGYTARLAPQLADAIATGLAAPEARVDEVTAAAWRAIWPRPALRSRGLYAVGTELLASLDTAGVRDFFDAFFALAPARWSGFLSRDLPPTQLSTTMLRLFMAAAPEVRGRLRRASLMQSGRLLRTLLRPEAPTAGGFFSNGGLL